MATKDLSATPLDDEAAARHFMALLQNDTYIERVQNMLTNEERRLPINMDHLRVIDDRLPGYVTKNPAKTISALESRLGDVVKDMGDFGKHSK